MKLSLLKTRKISKHSCWIFHALTHPIHLQQTCQYLDEQIINTIRAAGGAGPASLPNKALTVTRMQQSTNVKQPTVPNPPAVTRKPVQPARPNPPVVALLPRQNLGTIWEAPAPQVPRQNACTIWKAPAQNAIPQLSTVAQNSAVRFFFLFFSSFMC